MDTSKNSEVDQKHNIGKLFYDDDNTLSNSFLPLTASVVAAFIFGFFVKDSIFSLFSYTSEKMERADHKSDKMIKDIGNIDYTEGALDYLDSYIYKNPKRYRFKTNPSYLGNLIKSDMLRHSQSKVSIAKRRKDPISETHIQNGKLYHNSMPVFLTKTQEEPSDFNPFFPQQDQYSLNGYQHASQASQLDVNSEWQHSKGKELSTSKQVIQTRNKKNAKPPKHQDTYAFELHPNKVNDNPGWEEDWKRLIKLETVIAGVDTVQLEKGLIRPG